MNLPTPYQDFIHLSRYSRWLPDEGRREQWDETVDRLIGFFDRHLSENYEGFKFEKYKLQIICRK